MLIVGIIIAFYLLFTLLYKAVQISSLHDDWERGVKAGYIKENWFKYLEIHIGIKQINNGKERKNTK